jgi:hypothetical protein
MMCPSSCPSTKRSSSSSNADSSAELTTMKGFSIPYAAALKTGFCDTYTG